MWTLFGLWGETERPEPSCSEVVVLLHIKLFKLGASLF